MLLEDSQNANKEGQSEELLASTSTQERTKEIVLWKRAVLLAIGNAFSLSVIALVVGTIFKSWGSTAVEGVYTFVTYGIIFSALAAVVGVDVKKLFQPFKKWQPYLIGIGIGAGVIIFDMVYFNIVNLFYQTGVSDNESSIRSLVSLYPVSSVLIFGFVGPICEELTYRVGLFGLCKKVNRVFAYILTGLIFGLIHFNFASSNLINELICLPSYIIPGVLFSLAYDFFGFPCSLTAHLTNNLWAIGAQIILINS